MGNISLYSRGDSSGRNGSGIGSGPESSSGRRHLDQLSSGPIGICLLEAGNGENFEITQDGGGRARVLAADKETGRSSMSGTPRRSFPAQPEPYR